MAWVYVGVGTAVETIATGHTLTEPANCVAGDLLVAVIASRIASTTSITLPSGWTLVSENKTNNVLAASTTGVASAMMAYIVRGTAAPALTFTHPTAPSVAVGRIVAYRNGAEVSPLDANTNFKTATAVTAVSGAGLTTTAANDLIVMGVAGGQAASWTNFDAVTDPTTTSGTGSSSGAAPTVGTWLERADTTTATGADTSLGIADAIRGTAGATGNLTVTASLGASHAVVAGAFKIATTGFVAFNWAETIVSGTTLAVTLPEATQAGDVILFAGFGNANTLTVKTNNNDTGIFGTLGGAQTPLTNVNAFFNFVGRIVPTVGSTSVTLTQLAASQFKALGCWIVRGWSGLAQDKGVWIKDQTGALNLSGLTGTLSVAAEAVVSFNFANATTLSINLAQTGSGAFRSDAIATNNHCAWSHQITSTTGSIQAAWNMDTGGGDTLLATYAIAVTGTLVEAEDPDVAALNATVRWVATLTEAEDPDVAALNATVRWSAPLATTEAPDVAAMTGTVFTPTLAATETADVAVITGAVAAVPNIIVTDDFNRADGGLGSNWTSLTGPFRIASNAAESGQAVGGQSRSIWTATSFANDHYAEVTVANSASGGSKVGLMVRGQPGADSGYYVSADTGGAEIFKVVAGTSTSLNWAGITLAIGDVLRMEANGTSLVVKQNGVVRNTITDSTFSSGYPGIFANYQARLDNFVAGGTTVTDDFNRANGGLGGNWLTVIDPLVIESNVARGGAMSVGHAVAAWIANSFSNDQFAEVSVADLSAGKMGAVVRAQTTGANCYIGMADPGGTNIFKVSGGSFTDMASGGPGAANGDVVRLEVTGTTLTLKVNGSTRCTVSDSTFASGYPGVYATTYAASKLDNFFAGTVTGAGPVSGTLATTEVGDTAAVTGAVSWQATLAASETADAGVLNGTVRWAATLATTEAVDVAALTATVRWAATLATTEAADVAALTGAVSWQAVLATTEAPDTANFTGGILSPLTGTLGVIETPDVANIAGGVAWVATLATVEAADVAALTATVRWAATLATGEAPDVAALTGAVSWAGALTTTEALDVAALAGTVRWAATLTATETPDAGAFLGAVRWAATLATTEAADTAAFTGGIYASGPLTVSEAPDVAAFTATAVTLGTLAAPEAPDIAAFTGGIYGTGTLATTEAPDVATINAQIIGAGLNANLVTIEAPDGAVFSATVSGNAGPLAATETADTAAATGQVRWATVLAATEPPDVASFAGTARTLGTLAATEAADAAVFTGQIVGAGGLTVFEPPDVATIIATTRWMATLSASEAPDRAAFSGSSIVGVTLAATEAPDIAAFTINIHTDAVLDTREAPDRAFFTSAPVSIQGAPGSILGRDQQRVRDLTSDSQRVRSLKYPIPRPRDLVNTMGPRIRDLDARRRVRILAGD